MTKNGIPVTYVGNEAAADILVRDSMSSSVGELENDPISTILM
jgi:hypothetical protein